MSSPVVLTGPRLIIARFPKSASLPIEAGCANASELVTANVAASAIVLRFIVVIDKSAPTENSRLASMFHIRGRSSPPNYFRSKSGSRQQPIVRPVFFPSCNIGKLSIKLFKRPTLRVGDGQFNSTITVPERGPATVEPPPSVLRSGSSTKRCNRKIQQSYRVAMPRYFFNIHAHIPTSADEIGEELRDDEAAWKEATMIAGEIFKDIDGNFRPDQEWALEVTEARSPST
jgi:hypothetical protein